MKGTRFRMKSCAAIGKTMGQGSRVPIVTDSDPGARAPADQIEAIARESGGTTCSSSATCRQARARTGMMCFG